jgi:phosphate butyryltransferase
MGYSKFSQIAEKVKNAGEVKRMAIAAANDCHTLEAAMEARKAGLVRPVLVGAKSEISAILNKMGESFSDDDIYDEADGAKACELAVKLIRENKADFLMKGNIDTGILLKAVVNKETGLAKGSLMSLFTIFEMPTYHKLLTIVDGGMVPYPTLEQKKFIIENTVDFLLALGYEKPKLAVLACIEKLNPKMPETVEADELAQMNKRGEIVNCIIEGPVSYDCAISKEIADMKGYVSEISGDVDIMLTPNIHAGNILAKALICNCGAKLAGIVVGATCPIVLTSRGSSAEEKLLSIMLSAAVNN